MSAECGGRGRAWQKHSRASVAHTGRPYFLQSSRCQGFSASLGISASHGFGMDVGGSTLVMRGVFRAESLLLSFPRRFFGGTGVLRRAAGVRWFGSRVPGLGWCVPVFRSHGPVVGSRVPVGGSHVSVSGSHVGRVRTGVPVVRSCVPTVGTRVPMVGTQGEMAKIDHFRVETVHFAMNRAAAGLKTGFGL
jgi:hypothetical protein